MKIASARLSRLAAVANSAHEAGERESRKGIEHFRRAGEALIAAKEQCGHGNWLKWLEENVRFSERQVRNYMQLAKSAVTADLESAWRTILGNNREPAGSEPLEPGPFLPSNEQAAIFGWLMHRREEWPEQFRSTFINFVRRILEHMEADGGDNRGERANCAAIEESAA